MTPTDAECQDVAALLESQFEPMRLDRPGLATADDVISLVTRSPFRRTRVNKESMHDISQKVLAAMGDNAPIRFAIPFGGYKSWICGRDTPDWAEVFALRYLVEYAQPIVSGYSGGVEIDFTYMSGVLKFMSNDADERADRYMQSFTQLVAEFSNILPEGLKIKSVDIRSLYTPLELDAEIASSLEELRPKWEGHLDDERLKRRNSAARNLRPSEEQLGATESWDQACRQSGMRCEAIDSLSKRRGYNKFSERVQLVYVRGPQLSLHIGACRTSSRHFWVSSGAVEIDRERRRVLPTLLPPGSRTDRLTGTFSPSSGLEFQPANDDLSKFGPLTVTVRA